ncbi:hypothetical protein L873DRAFT_776855 [Choiromyces venosus 120613-1]|uniref:Uncharacterized protein n=1 Tax=Choiromyces venosus 120613-1 TaxID=1336337 RepID=A0A3N4JTG7_9PEZI|nr:hypothetical protein L873DRAFT_776855 [Choiromyces venosus 120613-1]
MCNCATPKYTDPTDWSNLRNPSIPTCKLISVNCISSNLDGSCTIFECPAIAPNYCKSCKLRSKPWKNRHDPKCKLKPTIALIQESNLSSTMPSQADKHHNQFFFPLIMFSVKNKLPRSQWERNTYRTVQSRQGSSRTRPELFFFAVPTQMITHRQFIPPSRSQLLSTTHTVYTSPTHHLNISQSFFSSVILP